MDHVCTDIMFVQYRRALRDRTYRDNLNAYARYMFSIYVVEPAYDMEKLLILNDYLNATEEERQDEKFAELWGNIYHEDDDSFFLYDLGTVHTDGKPLTDLESNWRVENFKLSREDEDTWIIGDKARTYITLVGKNDSGKYCLEVETLVTDKARTSEYNNDEVYATLSMPAGPMTIINPTSAVKMHYSYETYPEGYGSMRIEFEKNHEIVDWAELTYTEDGMHIICTTSLD